MVLRLLFAAGPLRPMSIIILFGLAAAGVGGIVFLLLKLADALVESRRVNQALLNYINRLTEKEQKNADNHPEE